MKTEDKTNQGEGDRESDRRYRQGAGEFVKSGKVDDAAQRAKSSVETDGATLLDAERAGKARAAEEDPAFFEQNDDAVRYGLHAALQVVHEGDWNDELDTMLGREWQRLHGGNWDDVRPLVKKGWAQGRTRMGKA